MLIQGYAKHQLDFIQIKYGKLGDQILCIELPLNKESIIEFPEGEIMVEVAVKGDKAMEDYYFMYQDSVDRWHEVTNPEFIAQYRCRAYHKSELKGKTFTDLVWGKNNLHKPTPLQEKRND